MQYPEQNYLSANDSVHPIPIAIEDETPRSNLMKKGIDWFFKPTVRNGWVALANQGVFSGTNFLTGVIIGRSCSKGEFGLYMLGFSIVLFVFDLQVALISTPYMVYSPRLKGRSLRLYSGSSLIHQLALTIIILSALAVWGGLLSFGLGPPGLARVMWALVAVIAFIMFREFVRRICFAHLRMEIALLLDCCVAVVQIVGLIILYRLGILSANRAYWVIGCACAIAGTGWLFLNRKAFILQVSQSLSDFKHNWKFGKWVFFSGLLWAASMNLYPWFLTVFHGTASVGVWGACLGVMALVNVPLTGVQNFLGPKIANVYAAGGVRALRKFAFKASLVLGLVMGLLSCALFIIGGPLLVLFYGDKYSGNGLVVSMLALGLVAASVAFAFSRAFFAIERADVDFKINFIPLFILFTIGLWLVRSFGPLGAASGLLLAHLAASGVRWTSFAILTRPSAEGAS
jgi:O-antigen/teichoic acid export membrane protein